MNDLVSIIIPAFNAEQYLERTLFSASHQTYRNIEIIIINDGSNDRTGLLAEEFSKIDQRAIVIHVPNGGVARARNLGISMARGDYLAFLDADDIWHPTKIERQLHQLRSSQDEYAASYTMYRKIDEYDNVISSVYREQSSGYILTQHLYARFVGNGSSLLVRAEAAREVGGFDPSFADANIGGCEDLDFELKLAAQYKMIGLQSYLVGYRRYEGNMSSNRTRMVHSMIATTNKHLFANNHIPIYAKVMALSSSYSYCFTCMASNKSFFKAIFWLLRLALIDFFRALDDVVFAMAWVFRQIRQSNHQNNANFYTSNPDELLKNTNKREMRRVDRLAKIDRVLWQGLHQRIIETHEEYG